MTWTGFVSAPEGVRGQKPFVDDEEKGCSRRMQTGEESARAMARAGRGVQADSVGGP